MVLVLFMQLIEPSPRDASVRFHGAGIVTIGCYCEVAAYFNSNGIYLPELLGTIGGHDCQRFV